MQPRVLVQRIFIPHGKCIQAIPGVWTANNEVVTVRGHVLSLDVTAIQMVWGSRGVELLNCSLVVVQTRPGSDITSASQLRDV